MNTNPFDAQWANCTGDIRKTGRHTISVVHDVVCRGHPGLVEVRQFTQFHFKFEEALMRLYGYTDSAEHAEAYRKILREVVGIEQASVQKHAEEGVLTSRD